MQVPYKMQSQLSYYALEMNASRICKRWIFLKIPKFHDVKLWWSIRCVSQSATIFLRSMTNPLAWVGIWHRLMESWNQLTTLKIWPVHVCDPLITPFWWGKDHNSRHIRLAWPESALIQYIVALNTKSHLSLEADSLPFQCNKVKGTSRTKLTWKQTP